MNRGLIGQIEPDKFDSNVMVALVDLGDDGLDFALCAAGKYEELWLTGGKKYRGLGAEATLAGAGNEDYMKMNRSSQASHHERKHEYPDKSWSELGSY